MKNINTCTTLNIYPDVNFNIFKLDINKKKQFGSYLGNKSLSTLFF